MSYIAPINGVCNIWIKTLDEDDAYPITHEEKQDIQFCFWQYDNKHVFYVQDVHGDENYHLYRINIKTKEKEDLTPFKGVVVELISYTKHLPCEIIVAMNKRDEAVFDVYKIDLDTNKITMIAQNPGNITSWLVDWNNVVKGAMACREDGGNDGLIRLDENSNWKKIASWDLEDGESLFSHFSKDGKYIYAFDSRNYNTKRLIKISVSTGEKTVIFEDSHYDFVDTIENEDTWKLQAGYYYAERKKWVFFDDTFEQDMSKAMKLDHGDVSLSSRDQDDRKWIIRFTRDTGLYLTHDSLLQHV
jgi:hypothetical protein